MFEIVGFCVLFALRCSVETQSTAAKVKEESKGGSGGDQAGEGGMTALREVCV